MSKIAEALGVLLEVTGKELTPTAADFIVRALSAYPERPVLDAIHRCALELPRFPSLAEIIERVEDGRPGAEEAWALVPKSENDSAVWSDEMREAYATASKLLPDKIAARLAFLEAYRKLIQEARAARRPVKWTTTLGHDKGRHASVLKEAVEKGRLTGPQAQALLPDLTVQRGNLQLTGPEEKPDLENIRKIREMLSKSSPVQSIQSPNEERIAAEKLRRQAARMGEHE